ncbi:MAG: hypothetical protein MPK30_00305 [Gammaproteobacteria bacterium]|nr:hypothetical protein [Gammaproteobacteria bacterium]
MRQNLKKSARSAHNRRTATSEKAKLSSQIVANIGLFHVCHELSRRGMNVVPTSRNTRSVDIIVGSADFSRHATIQVKASTTQLGTRVASSMPDKNGKGTKEEAILKSKLADFWVFVRIDKESGYTIQDSAVCEGGDSVLLSYGNTHWWYEPWYPTDNSKVAAKWDRQKGDAGWKLISDRLASPPPRS